MGTLGRRMVTLVMGTSPSPRTGSSVPSDGEEDGHEERAQDPEGPPEGELGVTDLLLQKLVHPVLEEEEPLKMVPVLAPYIARFSQLKRGAAQRTAPLHCKDAAAIIEQATDPDFHAVTATATGALLGVDRIKFAPTLRMYANALVHGDRKERSTTEHIVAGLSKEGLIRLLHYVDMRRYDESRFTVTKKSVSSKAPEPGPEPEAAREPSETTALEELEPEAFALEIYTPRKGTLEQAGKDKVASKLFQTRTDYGLGFQILGLEPEDAPRAFVFLTGSCVNWLQLLQRTTAEVIRTALEHTSSASESSLLFVWRTQLSTSDAYAANHKAERHFREQRPGWLGMHFDCDLHPSHTAFEKTFGILLPDVVTGTLNLALACNHLGVQTTQREIVRDWIVTNAVVLWGAAASCGA